MICDQADARTAADAVAHGQAGAPPLALRAVRLEPAVALRDDRFVLRATAIPGDGNALPRDAGALALRAATLSTKGVDACVAGAIFKDGFESPGALR